MKVFSRLPLQFKILLAPAVVSLFVLIYLGYTFLVAKDNAERIADLRENRFVILDLAITNANLLDKITENLNAGATAGEVDMVNSTDSLADQIRGNLKAIGQRAAKEKARADDLRQAFDAYFVLAKKISLTMASGKSDFSSLQADIAAMGKSLDTIRHDLADCRQAAKDGFVADMQATSAASSRAVTIGLVCGLISIALALAVAYFVAFAIKHSMDEVVDSLREIAEGDGDLRNRIPQGTEDEIGQLVRWFNTFVDKLQKTIAELVDDVGHLDSMTRDLSGVEAQMEQLLDSERQRILQVTEHVKLIAEQARQVADNASSASGSAQEVQDKAGIGKEAVQTTIGQIEALAAQIDSAADATRYIEKDGQNISSVVEVIKDIADQTNLLALNAAIEAARAGEQGRGFAVVADEVRKLAEKTKSATVEVYRIMETLLGNTRTIVTVVQDSQAKAESAVANVQDTGQTLEAMLRQVDLMSEMNSQIASYTEQQRTAVAHVSESSEELSQISEQVKGHAGHTGEISKRVAALAIDLKRISDQFKV